MQSNPASAQQHDNVRCDRATAIATLLCLMSCRYLYTCLSGRCCQACCCSVTTLDQPSLTPSLRCLAVRHSALLPPCCHSFSRHHIPSLQLPSMSTDKTSELLADVSIQDLMNEVQRRLDCTKKPDKRLILIGPPGSTNTTLTRRTVSESLQASPGNITHTVLHSNCIACRLRQGHSGSSPQA